MGAFDDLIPGAAPAAGAFDDLIPKQPEGGFIPAAKQAIGQTIKGVGQVASDYIPGVTSANPVSAYGQEVIDANPTTVNSLSDIASSPWQAVKEATGNAGGSMASMLGARALGMGITAASPLTGPAAPFVAGAGQLIANVGPWAAAALPSYSGIREAQIKDSPTNEADAKSKAIALLGAGTVGKIETAFGPQEWALAAMRKGGLEAFAKNMAEKFGKQGVAATVGKGIAHGAAVEGAEELVQNPIEQLASYQDPRTPENISETLHGGAMGGIGGGVLGGGMAGASRLVSQKQDEPPPGPLSKSVDKGIESGIVQQKQAEQAIAQEQADMQQAMRDQQAFDKERKREEAQAKQAAKQAPEVSPESDQTGGGGIGAKADSIEAPTGLAGVAQPTVTQSIGQEPIVQPAANAQAVAPIQGEIQPDGTQTQETVTPAAGQQTAIDAGTVPNERLVRTETISESEVARGVSQKPGSANPQAASLAQNYGTPSQPTTTSVLPSQATPLPVPVAQKAPISATTDAQATTVKQDLTVPDLSSRTDKQLAYLSTNGNPGYKEAAIAEIAKRENAAAPFVTKSVTDTAANPIRAYTEKDANRIAAKMTTVDNLPSEAYPHPTEPGKYAIRAKSSESTTKLGEKIPPKQEQAAKPSEQQGIVIGSQNEVAESDSFEHSGYAIRKTNIKQADGTIVQRWAVQSEDNRKRAANGERQIGGDSLQETRDAAIKEAERQSIFEQKNAESRAREKQVAAEEDAKLVKQQAERDDIDGFMQDATPMVRGRAVASLSKMVNLNGEVSSLRDAVRRLVAQGKQPEARQEDRIKEMSRAQFFRADQRTQDAHEKRRKEAGQKTVYSVGGFDLGKTAHDYAEYLIATNPAPTEQAAPKADEARKIASKAAKLSSLAERMREAMKTATAAQKSNLEARLKRLEAAKPIEKKAEESAAVAQNAPSDESSPSSKVSEFIKSRLSSNQPVAWIELFKEAAQAWGTPLSSGKYSVKDIYDAMEVGVNQWIRKSKIHTNVNAESAKDAAENLTELLRLLPTQTKRTAEQDEFQQFSTPPALSYVASWVAGVNKTDVMMEPSAGTGDLAIWAENAGASLILNELSPRRATLLGELFPSAKIYTENAEQINNVLPANVVPTVVVMNPPFSATAGRVQGSRNTMNGAKHIEQALLRLADGGRLVAIVGEGMAADRPAFKTWWKKIAKDYNVRANIGISGKEYAKYGTTFDNQILVIDKNGATTGEIITGKVNSVAELPALLEGVRNDRNQFVEQTSVEQAGVSGNAQKQDSTGTKQTGSSATDDVGAGKQPRGSQPASGTDTGRRPGHQKPDSQTGEGKPEVADALPDADGQRGQLPDQPIGDVGRGSGDNAAGRVAVSDAGATKSNERGGITDAVFENYSPQRLRVAGAKPHPGKLVQSSAMASVEPPAPTYQPNLPKDIIDSGKLSIAQIESIVYAGQAHGQFLPNGERRGFFIGDGTGVGKGREIAGIILDNMHQGRKKAVWVSFSEGLINDAQRDFEGIGGDKGQVFWQGKTKPSDKVSAKQGILFTSYSTMKSAERKQANDLGQTSGRTRLDQMVEWLGEDFDGVVVFDEAHSMGNIVEIRGNRGTKKPSQQAIAGANLQNRLPKARVVYVSATGATEVSNLGYASRLGLWGEGTPFPSVREFIGKVTSGGVAAMELISRDMKALGMYIARSLSFDGVTYQRLEHDLSPLQTDIYNELAKTWQGVLSNVNAALETTGGAKSGPAKSAAMAAFWGSHQRFFNQIITSMQTPSVIDDMRKQIDAGNAIVVQLVNTNEATQEREVAKAQADGTSLEELDFTPRQMLIGYVQNSFPVQAYEESLDDNGNAVMRPVMDAAGNPVFDKEAVAMRDRVLSNLEHIRVPGNPIDEIVQAFGSDAVGEVTGRKRRFVKESDGKGGYKIVEEKRGKNAAQVDASAFQNDKKQILIFSQAGGTGFSFHADNTAKNQRKRVHYILQPGWRADAAVQGFGRTHRTNQASEPIYVLPTTNLKAQKRFVSSIARRLDQLGALTKGQRQATSQGMFSASDNLESQYAEDALEVLFNDMYRGNTSLDFHEVIGAMGLNGVINEQTGALNSGSLPQIPQFLNRLLSLQTHQQDAVFAEFEKRLDEVVNFAVQNGTYDTGLQTLQAQSIKKVRDDVAHTDQRTGAETRYVEIDVSNPIKYIDEKTAKAWAAEYRGKFAGWFKDGKGSVIGVVDLGDRINSRGDTTRRGVILKINGDRIYVDNANEVIRGWRYDSRGQKQAISTKIDSESEAMSLLSEQVKSAPKIKTKRERLIVGAILPVWDRVQGRPQIVRLQTDDGERMIGRMMGEKDAKQTIKNLGVDSSASKMSTSEIIASINAGDVAVLANQWTIASSRVSNESRIEIKTPGRYFSTGDKSVLVDQGVFFERIQWEDRAFIPSGKDGEDVLARVTESKPVVDILSKDGETRFNQASNLNITPADSAVYDMASEGKSAAEILDFIGKASRRPFNRYLANALKRMGASSAVTLDSKGGWQFNRAGQKYAAAYNPRTDTVALFTPREAERHVIHELIHAATLKAIAKRGVAAIQMRALFKHVQASGKIAGMYGMSEKGELTTEQEWRTIEEFVAEAFSNPKFQQALKEVLAPSGSKLKSAWQWFVRLVSRAIGFKTPAQETALDRAMTVGAQLMAENAQLSGKAEGLRYATAHHGTPHLFAPEPGFPHGRFRLDKIGTGEGAQAYGWGVYFAERKGVASSYQSGKSILSYEPKIGGKKIEDLPSSMLEKWEMSSGGAVYGMLDELRKSYDPHATLKYYAEKGNDLSPIAKEIEAMGVEVDKRGTLYRLDIPDDVMPKLLDWDKPANEQSAHVIKALESLAAEYEKRTAAIRQMDDEDPRWISKNQEEQAAVMAELDALGRAAVPFKFGAEAFRKSAHKKPLQPHARLDETVGDLYKKALGYALLRENPRLLAEALNSAGIPGLRYLDGNSRNEGAGSHNYVIWDQKTLDRIALLERNGEKLDDLRFSQASDTINVDGKERPRTNSNGKPIAGTDEALRKFYAWFKNSAVVDSEGRPLVVYHGTNSEFGVFRTEAGPRSAMVGDWNGAHFTNDSAQADGIAGSVTRMGGGQKRVVGAYLKAERPVEYGKFRTQEQAIAAGHDSRLTENNTGLQEWTVFEPNQIKSADQNNGEFSPDNPDIRFNVESSDQWASSSADNNTLDDIIYKIANKQIDLRRTVQDITKKIGELADEYNPELAETNYHGRAANETKTFLDFELRPLIRRMLALGVDTETLETYLWARHAEERNEQIAKINPRLPDGGSGLTNAQARQLLAGQDVTIDGKTIKGVPQDKLIEIGELASMSDAILNKSRELLVSSGLESKAEVDSWSAMYQHYAPLHREEFADDRMTGKGLGMSIKGPSGKRAIGSEKPVSNILASIVSQREMYITRAEKNKVGNATYGLATIAPNEDFWQAIDPMANASRDAQQLWAKIRKQTEILASKPDGDEAMEAIIDAMKAQHKALMKKAIPGMKKVKESLEALGLPAEMADRILAEPKELTINKRTGMVVERVNPLLRHLDNVLATRINGRDVFVVFNARDKRASRMAMAMKNLDADHLGFLLGNMAKATRYFAAINTQFNPIFGVTNLTRDIQTAMLNLSSTPLANHKAEIAKRTFSALHGIYRDLRDHRAGKEPSSQWADTFEQFKKHGGATGYRDMFETLNDRAKDLQDELKKMGMSKGRRLVTLGQSNPVFAWLSDYNEMMENAARVAAFSVAIEQGMSPSKAAALAKELTVNFNRKGQVAAQAGAMYAFFNAAVQGTARIAQTLVTLESGKPRLTPAGKKIIAGGIMLGVVQAILGALAGWDDEEPPQFVRERSLIIPMGDHYVSIPMPLGYNVLPNIGRITAEFALSGFKDPAKRISSLLNVLADTFNPIGNAGMSLQTITPTVIDPLAALSENKDWTGKPIKRLSFNEESAGYKNAKDTATAWSKLIAEGLNYLSGGTEHKAGLFSPTPDQIDYLIGQVTGGVGREVSKIVQTGSSIISGEDLPLYKVPLAGKFVGSTTGQAAESSRFYENIRELKAHKAEIDGRRKAQQDVTGYLRDNPDARMVPMATKIESRVQELRRMKRALLEKDAPQAQIKAIDERITATMGLLNRRVDALQRSSK